MIAAARDSPPLQLTLQPLEKLGLEEVSRVLVHNTHAEHFVACDAEEVVPQLRAPVLTDDGAVCVPHKVRRPVCLDDHALITCRDKDICATRAIANERLHLRRALDLLRVSDHELAE
jgi:hypothetical protein